VARALLNQPASYDKIQSNLRKKHPMITKPSISFLNDDSDAELLARVTAITTALDGNTHYPTPAPTLAVVNAATEAFATAVAEATGGGTALTAAKNEKRAALVALVRELASYIQVACKGDLAVLLTSGFPHQKPAKQPIGELPPPANLQVKLGARSGQLATKVDPVPGASIYNWRLWAPTSPDNPVQTRQTTAARNTFTGLTPGVIYSVEVNAFGAAGPSNWAGPAKQMVV
jgi:hypothetical protein